MKMMVITLVGVLCILGTVYGAHVDALTKLNAGTASVVAASAKDATSMTNNTATSGGATAIMGGAKLTATGDADVDGADEHILTGKLDGVDDAADDSVNILTGTADDGVDMLKANALDGLDAEGVDDPFDGGISMLTGTADVDGVDDAADDGVHMLTGTVDGVEGATDAETSDGVDMMLMGMTNEKEDNVDDGVDGANE